MAHGHHHGHADGSDPFQRQVAVVLAMYSVELAFINMLTNQSRTQAILRSNEAANKWSYYQSKSTKQLMVKSESSILDAIAGSNKAQVDKLKAEAERYEGEKAGIQKEAEALQAQAKAYEHKEHYFEYAAVGAELGIVLAGVSLLVSKKAVFYVSIVLAALAVVATAYTAFALKH